MALRHLVYLTVLNSDMVPRVTNEIENVDGAGVEVQDGAEPAVLDSARESKHLGEQVELEGVNNLMDPQTLDNLSISEAIDALENYVQSFFKF